jgi:hypothetical protein
MRFHEVPWDSMRFYDVLVNRSVPTEANRGLTSYMSCLRRYSAGSTKLLNTNNVPRACCKAFRATPFVRDALFCTKVSQQSKAAANNLP